MNKLCRLTLLDTTSNGFKISFNRDKIIKIHGYTMLNTNILTDINLNFMDYK